MTVFQSPNGVQIAFRRIGSICVRRNRFNHQTVYRLLQQKIQENVYFCASDFLYYTAFNLLFKCFCTKIHRKFSFYAILMARNGVMLAIFYGLFREIRTKNGILAFFQKKFLKKLNRMVLRLFIQCKKKQNTANAERMVKL